MSAPPSKIVLNQTSKVSLHDRFTKLAKTKPTVEARTSKPAVHVASAKNRNLALQMAARPSVKSALNPRQAPNKRSLNQRLGNGNRIDSARIDIGRKGIPTRQGPLKAKAPIGKQPNRIQNGNRFGNKVAISRVGPKGGMGLKNRIKFLNKNNLQQKMQKPEVKASVNKKNFKGNKLGNKKPAPAKKTEPKNKEGLDMDLDNYMLKTKSGLDNDLDSYMAEAI
jgi:hypothetical protein